MSVCARLLVTSALVAALAFVPAYGQDVAGDVPNSQATVAGNDGNAKIFLPGDFAQYSPQTALDMVVRIPGFSIQQADSKRGLGQAGGNVLINGKRFSGKSNDAVSELGRISADNVIRIELVDGAALDIPGLSGQVVNIISKVTGLTGQYRWSPRYRPLRVGFSLLDGEASITGKADRFGYTLSAVNDSFRGGNAGPELVTDASGFITETRGELLTFRRDRPRISGSLNYQGENGDLANLNLAYGLALTRTFEASDSALRTRNYAERENEWNAEIGGDYELGIGSDRLKLIGLYRAEHSPFFTRVLFDVPGDPVRSGSRQRRTIDESESIVRAEYNWKAGRADWQLSAEGAYNTLDNAVAIERLNAAGEFQPVAFAGANASVAEKRGEVAATYSRPIATNLNLQTSLGGEYSVIAQSGPAGLTRSFIRPKGLVSLAWKASPRLDISGRIEREVGQLDFGDFLASTDIGSGNQNSGNPNLVPPQSWNTQIELNRNFGALGSLSQTLRYAALEDVVDQVPIGANGEAPGNIASAVRYASETSATITFDPLGWHGARIDLGAEFQKSRIRDPLTGEKRSISGDFVRSLSAEFRQDIPKGNWAYGAGYSQYRQAPDFRLGLISRSYDSPDDISIFVENKNVAGLKIRASIFNLLGTNETFSRTFYTGRRTGPVAFSESRSRQQGPTFALDVSGTF